MQTNTNEKAEQLEGRRLFAGVYPCGIVYADRWREERGDYKRLAFLPYSTMVLEFQGDCPAELKARIEADAERIRRRGAVRLAVCGPTIKVPTNQEGE